MNNSRAFLAFVALLADPMQRQASLHLLARTINDRSVSAGQSLALAEQLQKLGKTYELIIYAQDNHYLSRNQDDRDRRAVTWFKRHMKTNHC